MPEKPAEASKEWVPSLGGATLKCSACKKKIGKEAKSCPHCKAKLGEKPVSATVAFVPGDMAKAHEVDVAREKKVWPWFSIGLAALLMGVFVLQLVPGFTLFFIMVPAYLASEPWVLLTNIFLHADPMHIFFNLIGLWVFGVALEKVTRKSFMALVFVASGIMGSIGAVLLTNDPSTGFLGASGGIFGLIGAVMILRPNMLVNLRGMNVPMKFVGPIYMLIELVSFGAVDNIAHSAHVFGMFGGIALGVWWQRGGSRTSAPILAFCCVLAVFSSFAVAIPLGMMQPTGHTFEERFGSVIAAGDTTFCTDFFEIGSGQSHCFMLIAVAKRNPDICMRLEDDLASFCVTNVALANGDKEACLQDAWFEPCMALLDPEFRCSGNLDCEILKSRDPSRCDELNEDASSLCRLFVGIADKNSAACAENDDFCKLYLGVSFADQSACLSIKDAGLKRVCMTAVDNMGSGG